MYTTTTETNLNMTCEIAAMGEAEFTQFVTERATAAGLRPAQWQRAVDWKAVRSWALRVRTKGFAWKAADRDGTDAIVVGPALGGGVAIHAGQHRILGGIAGGNPVPAENLTWVNALDRAKAWFTPASANGGGFTADDLLLALSL